MFWQVLLFTIAFVSVCTGVRAQMPAPGGAVQAIALPPSVTFPEGVAFDEDRNVLYTASAVDGTVARVNPATGATEIVVPAGVLVPQAVTGFPAILGMKVDGRNRLWIAGGATGRMLVVDLGTGGILKEFKSPFGRSLINDVVLVDGAAYFTDTRVPALWRVSADGDQIGELEAWLDFSPTPLQYDANLNLNGIAAPPGGSSLFVVQMTKGLLFHIDTATKRVTPVDLGGADLSGADGLVLDGLTLYVVRQTAEEIATVKLEFDFRSGTVVSRFKDPQLAWPATATKVGDRLIVVNSQFNRRSANTAAAPFTLLSVPVSALAAN